VRRRRADRRTSTSGSSMAEPYRPDRTRTLRPHPVDCVGAGQDARGTAAAVVVNSATHRRSTALGACCTGHPQSYPQAVDGSCCFALTGPPPRPNVACDGAPRPHRPIRMHGEGVQNRATGQGTRRVPAGRSARHPAVGQAGRPAARFEAVRPRNGRIDCRDCGNRPDWPSSRLHGYRAEVRCGCRRVSPDASGPQPRSGSRSPTARTKTGGPPWPRRTPRPTRASSTA
jgi:hypothetical protein